MYKAKVIKTEDIQPLQNSDNLNVLTYNGMKFIVGKDLKIGELVILFSADGQLSHQYCYENNLYSDQELNKNKEERGYFSSNRKIKSIRLRGTVSEGFVATFNTLKFVGKFNLSENEEFDSINGIEICRKYISPSTERKIRQNVGQKEKKQSKIIYNLPEHYDTEQMDYNYDKLPDHGDIIITVKIHGTSARTGNVLVDKDVTNKFVSFMLSKMPRFCKFTNRLFKSMIFSKKYHSDYDYVSGTRHTIINGRPDIENGAEKFRLDWHYKIAPSLNRDEVVYYEIAGFDSFGSPIMNVQPTEGLKDKKFFAKYGSKMVYSYGCNGDSPNRIFVYRITQNGIDLPFAKMIERCNQLDLPVVPVICAVTKNTNEEMVSFIKSKLSNLLDNSSSFADSSHIEEGYVVRIESDGKVKAYKAKNSYFKILEGYMKEEDVIDMEEAS